MNSLIAQVLMARVASFAALTGVLVLLNGCACCCPKKRAESTAPNIFLQPESQTVRVGSNVTFTVLAENPPPYDSQPVFYQWQFNGVVIAGATNPIYTISNVQHSSAGSYSAEASGPGGSTESEDGDLTVSEPTPDGGILTIPVGSFTGGGNSCLPTALNKYTNLVFFLGPLTPPPTPNNYPNDNNLPRLTVDTYSTANGTTLDTGVLIVHYTNPTDKVCNDDGSPPFATNPKLSKATKPMNNNAKYRVGVFYKSPLPPGVTGVTVNYLYHNP